MRLPEHFTFRRYRSLLQLTLVLDLFVHPLASVAAVEEMPEDVETYLDLAYLLRSNSSLVSGRHACCQTRSYDVAEMRTFVVEVLAGVPAGNAGYVRAPALLCMVYEHRGEGQGTSQFAGRPITCVWPGTLP